jgi:serine phosphatase RsbU (regulator of sigma subunit)/pSer/pThr/pTyr-binding forkhead associated (FHA) protein
MADLVLLSGNEQGQRIPLQGDKIILGRDTTCDIVIKESMVRGDVPGDANSVSRKHAVISCEGGSYYIEDGDGHGRKSRNGVYVNDQKVPLKQRVLLRNNDRIRICNFVCVFQDELESSFIVEESIDHESSVHPLQAQPAETLRIILEISNSLSEDLEIDALLPRIVDRLFEIFKQADRGFIILLDESTGELAPRVTKTRRSDDKLRFSASIVRQCLNNMQSILGNDLPHQFPDSQSIAGLPVRSLICAPLWTRDGRPLGAIQLDVEGPSRKFTREDLNLLLGVASQASIALSNAQLHRDALINQARIRDLELAHQVQASFLPQSLPSVPGYEFFAHCESAREVGGDYYDFVPLPGQRWAVLLGDVAGKGVAAALVMVKFSVEARGCLLSEPDPAIAVRNLNVVMSRSALMDRFVTLVLVILDPATHTATLLNAGHPLPLLFRHATGSVGEAGSGEVGDLPLGIDGRSEYRSCQVQLQPGDRLVLFSDGITEAMDGNGRLFGKKRAMAAIEGAGYSVRETGERLLGAVKQYAAGCNQNDDITLVCFGRGGN